MADVSTLTKAQEAVVNHENGALLVSAAAGSGKTFVLVERLMRKICDPSNPCNVDDFLIITFTKASAAELRDRISKEIRKKLADQQNNKHLCSQLSRVYLANISTVHAFCAELLRDYAYRCDFPSDFRVLEEQSAISLIEEALNETMERIYAEPDADPDRAAMLNLFAFLHDDSDLRELILNLQKRMCANAFPEEWVENCKNMLSVEAVKDASDTAWGEFLLGDTRFELSELAALMQEACELAEEIAPGSACCRTLSDERDRLYDLSTKNRWSDFRQITTKDFSKLSFPDSCKEEDIKDRVKAIRQLAKESLISLSERFVRGSSDALSDVRAIAPALRGALDAACLYDKVYRQLKRRRKLLDFSDLERETVLLLTGGKRGRITEEAKEISKRFREIMVDEYQDTNEVQDVIFNAISKAGENLVMVGDVKQSIYRFRLADPDIFLGKYHSFSECPEMPGEPRKVLLSNNFRSRAEILDAANFVFRNVMSQRVGEVVYGAGEELLPRPSGGPADVPDDKVELHLIDTNGLEDNAVTIEARFIAKRITELLNGEHFIALKDGGTRRICADDIAILLEVTTNAPVILNTLLEAGIPAHCDREDSILETSEVQTLFSYLRIVDNPHQDVPLLSVLLSPVCGFSADELAAVRCEDLNCDYYDALRKYAEHHENAAEFLRTLDVLRERRRWMQPEEFLGLVVQRLQLLPLFSALPDGEERCGNLRHILKQLRDVIRSDVRTVSELIRRIDLILENPKGIIPKNSGSGVTITTIHKSKGLEYPVVFLSQLSRPFGSKDTDPKVLIDNELGLGCKTIDPECLATYPNLTRNAIAAKIKTKGRSERMRLLYVAMTRARERLIMTYAYPYKKFLDKLDRIALLSASPLPPAVAERASCIGDWILYAAALRPEAADWFRCTCRVHDAAYPWHIEFHAASVPEEVTTEQPAPQFPTPDYSALDRSYDLRASRVPAKLTATQLKGRSLDEETAENALPATAQKKAARRERVFEPERKALSPTEKGTAQHLFMQFCDYASCTTAEGIASEKKRLLEKRFLSEKQADAVNADRILQFFESELGRLVTQSADVRREFKFSLLTDAGRFTKDGQGEQLLLQGVIDCYVETDDGVVLLDFKTDNIRPGQETERAQSYRTQLEVYAEAITRILHKPVKRCCLYFFATGTSVDL